MGKKLIISGADFSKNGIIGEKTTVYNLTDLGVKGGYGKEDGKAVWHDESSDWTRITTTKPPIDLNGAKTISTNAQAQPNVSSNYAFRGCLFVDDELNIIADKTDELTLTTKPKDYAEISVPEGATKLIIGNSNNYNTEATKIILYLEQ